MTRKEDCTPYNDVYVWVRSQAGAFFLPNLAKSEETAAGLEKTTKLYAAYVRKKFIPLNLPTCALEELTLFYKTLHTFPGESLIYYIPA